MTGYSGMRANQIAGGQDHVQVIAADHMPEQRSRRQQAQHRPRR